MSSLMIASLMFACILASTFAAMMIARRLPGHHLNSESRDVVKLGLGVIGTLTAMVLSLLVSATKGTYDAQNGTVKELGAQLGVLDRALGQYGPEASKAQAQVRVLAEVVLEQLWPSNGAPADFNVRPTKGAWESIFLAVGSLEPQSDSQRLLKSRAQDILIGLGHIRQRLAVNSERSIPTPLLVVLGVWQAVLFAGFGLLAPRNGTTITVLVICMLSISGALFLVMELDRPFAGLVRVSNAPLRSVISHLGE